MRPIEGYISELMKKKGLKSYSQLSQKLEMNHGAIFNIMSKGVTPSDELCKRLADLAGEPVEKVLLLAAASRAPESTKKAWEHILKTTIEAGICTALLLCFSMASPTLSHVSTEKPVTKSFDITHVKYPLCDISSVTFLSVS